MALKCCVPMCSFNEKSTLLHLFPKDPELYLSWLNAIGRRDLCEQPAGAIRREFRICDAHFSEEQKFMGAHKRIKLKKTSVPDINCPCRSPRTSTARELRRSSPRFSRDAVSDSSRNASFERFEISSIKTDEAAENVYASSTNDIMGKSLVSATCGSNEEEDQSAQIDDFEIEDVEYEVEVFSDESEDSAAVSVPEHGNVVDGRRQNRTFECFSCSKNFPRKFTLQRHIQNVHNSENETYECASCSMIFTRKDNIRRHMITKCSRTEFSPPMWECSRCPAKFIQKYGLKQHMEIHNSTPANGNTKCPLCDVVFKKKAETLFHIEKHHHISLQREEMRFSSEAEFFLWKKDLEFRTRTHYRQCNHNKNKVDEIRVFICHRSGSYVKTVKGNQRSRRLKYQGSKKINCFCPGEIKLKKTKLAGNDVCQVFFTKTHIGHETNESELYHVPGATKKRRSPTCASEVPMRVAITECRITDKCENSNELNMVTSKKFRNAQAVNVAERICPTVSSDGSSVDAFVERNASSILYFKNEGELDIDYPIFALDDFILILMSETQKENLKKFGHDVVAMDGSRGIHDADFILLALLVVDDFREGCPVAFAVSNRKDDHVIKLFLNCVAKAVGIMKPHIFISDDGDAYYDSWVQIMGKPERRLFCMWHVRRTWRRNVNKIRNSVTRKAAMNCLNDLILETDQAAFLEKLEQFITNDDEMMVRFLDYFKTSYVNNTKFWAYCYRLFTGINTSVYLKDLHNQLKYWFTDDDKAKDLIRGLETLNNFLLRQESTTFVIEMKEKVGRKLKVIRRRHDNLEQKFDEEYPAIFIEKREPNQWLISAMPPSTQEALETYLVERLQEKKCTECKLVCDKCDVCFHEFRCSCTDSAFENHMCKHIHLLGMHLGAFSNTAMSPNNPNSRLSPVTAGFHEIPSPSAVPVPIESSIIKLESMVDDDPNCNSSPETIDAEEAPSSPPIVLVLPIEPTAEKWENDDAHLDIEKRKESIKQQLLDLLDGVSTENELRILNEFMKLIPSAIEASRNATHPFEM